MASRRNAPAQDITPFVIAGGVAGIGAATWFGYPGLPVLWLALVVAAWMAQAPPLTGKKDSYGYPTAANSAEERKMATYRIAKDLQSALILPVEDMLPGIPVRLAWLTSLWAAAVGWLLPVIGNHTIDPHLGHVLNAVAAFLIVAAIGGAKRRSLGRDNPGVRFDSLPQALRERSAAIVASGLLGGVLGIGLAGVITAVVARYGYLVGAPSLVPVAHHAIRAALPAAIHPVIRPAIHSAIRHPGISFVHPALVWLALGLGGAGIGVWVPWTKVAMADWRSLVDAREQWQARWAALKYDPAPQITDHKLIAYRGVAGPAEVTVDTFTAPAHIGAMEFYKLEKKLDPMVGSGVRTAVLSCPDADRGAPLPGTWSGVQFLVVAWTVANPPDITDSGVCATPESCEELASLRIRSSLAWACRALGGSVEPAIVSIEQLSGSAESDDIIETLDANAAKDQGTRQIDRRFDRLRHKLSEFWEKVKVAPVGNGEGTLAAAIAAEESGGQSARHPGTPGADAREAGPAGRPVVWATQWQFPSNLNAKYLRENGLGDVSEQLQAAVIVDHRNDAIYVGYDESIEDIDSETKAMLDGLLSEDVWRGRWTNALKQGANIPRVQPKTALEAKLDNGSTVHRVAFVINQGNSISEYMGVEANLASALNGAKFMAITGWHDSSQGGRPGDRHPQALCVYWSSDPVPLTPKWLVPTISPANRWVLNGIVNKEFQTARLARPEVVSARALTRPGADEHIWEVGLRLYGGVTTSDVRTKGARIAEDLAVPWVRVTDAEDGCMLYFGAKPVAEDLADPADMDRVIFLDWEQAFLESGVRGSNGAVPQLMETSYMPANDDVAVLEFSLPPGLDVAMVRAATAKLKTATGNAYVDVGPSSHGPTQIQIRACIDNPLPPMIPFDFTTADQLTGLAFATGVDGEPVVFDQKESAHVAVIGQSGSGKSVCMQGLTYCAAIHGAEIYVVDPMKAAADFRFVEPYARAVAVTIPDAAAVLKAVYQEVERRKQVNAQYGAGSYADLPDEVRPVPIIVVVDEFTSLITSENPPRAPFDDPELEAERLAQIATKNEQRTIGTMIGKLAREARSAGVTLVLGTQKLMAKSLDEVPGASDLKANLARILLGVASSGERMSALRAFDQAPDLGTPVPKGRGIWESAVASGIVIQTWFAPASTLADEIATRLEPLRPEEKLDLRPFLRKTEQAPGVIDLPDEDEQVEIDLGELELSLEDLADDEETAPAEQPVADQTADHSAADQTADQPEPDDVFPGEPAGEPVGDAPAEPVDLDWEADWDAPPSQSSRSPFSQPAPSPPILLDDDDPFADPVPATGGQEIPDDDPFA